MLHGMFGSAKNLNTAATALAKDFTVYSIDLPDHGESWHSDKISIESIAKAVMNTLDALGVKEFNVFGHSLGGKVAMSMALNYPHRIMKLAVGDIAPIAYPPHHREIIDALQALDLSIIDSRKSADAQLAKNIAEPTARQFLLQNLIKTPAGYEWKMNLQVIADSYPNLCKGIELPEGAAAYSKPVLFIAGSNSNYIKPKHESVMRELFPAFQYKQISGAGHWLHAEKPQIFNRLLSQFFTD